MTRIQESTHENNIKHLSCFISTLDRIHSKLTVLGNLDRVTKLFENLDGHALIDDIVLGEQNIVRHVAGSNLGLGRVGF